MGEGERESAERRAQSVERRAESPEPLITKPCNSVQTLWNSVVKWISKEISIKLVVLSESGIKGKSSFNFYFYFYIKRKLTTPQ